VRLKVGGWQSNVWEQNKNRLVKGLQAMGEAGRIAWEAQRWNNTVAPRQE